MERYIIGHHILLIMSKGYLGYVVLQGLHLTIAVWKSATQYLKGMHGAIQQLMSRKNKLMLQNKGIIF